ALWGKYNASEDPIGGGGNNNKKLLSAPAETVAHLGGLIINNPKPMLPRQNLPAYNAASAMEKQVYEGAKIPPSSPFQDKFKLKDRVADQWTDTKNAWLQTE